MWSLRRMPAGRPAGTRAIAVAHPRASASMAQPHLYVNGIALNTHEPATGRGTPMMTEAAYPLAPTGESTSEAVHPVDQRLPPARLVALGLQHVLVTYAGAVAVPLIIGAALKLPREQVALLISCDLFVSGIASLIQSVGVWR